MSIKPNSKSKLFSMWIPNWMKETMQKLVDEGKFTSQAEVLKTALTQFLDSRK